MGRCVREAHNIGSLLAACFSQLPLAAQKIKVIVDQDARGPGDQRPAGDSGLPAIRKFDVLGITTVSGDQWVKEETQHVLRLTRNCESHDVPVIREPNTPCSIPRKRPSDGKHFTANLNIRAAGPNRFQRATAPRFTNQPYHAPDVVPPMPEGEPHIHTLPGTAAEFIVQMVRKYPGEVVLWAGGPLTNYAIALKLDPAVATLAKEFVMMGGGLYANKGAIDPGHLDGRREFNWWFDPEAARIVLRAPWKKVTITPIDISVKTRLQHGNEGRHLQGKNSGYTISGQVFLARLHVGRNSGAA